MNILVTGGAGFIGSHLTDRLLHVHSTAQPIFVTVIDNLSCGHKEFVASQANFIQADITHKEQIYDIIKSGNFDMVYHLAAQKNLRYSFEHPQLDAEQNIIGFLHVLEACRLYGVKQVVYISSGGALYGDKAAIPTAETAVIHCSSPYAISKYTGELYAQYYAEKYQLQCTILRFANVYGPRQEPTGEAGVISIFIDCIQKGRSFTIFGDGEQTRDYVYVDDVVDACIRVLSQNLDLQASNQYNIGTGKETSVNTIAHLIQRVSGQAM